MIMIRLTIVLSFLVVALNARAGWPPIVESTKDVLALSPSTVSVRARGLHDEDIPALSHLPLLEDLDFGEGWKALTAPVTDKGLKITWGGQVREKPLHLTPYDYFEQEQAKQKAKSTASQC
jgi:hypothetical protein